MYGLRLEGWVAAGADTQMDRFTQMNESPAANSKNTLIKARVGIYESIKIFNRNPSHIKKLRTCVNAAADICTRPSSEE